MTIVVGKEVAINVPGRDEQEDTHTMVLAPGSTPETVFDTLNAHLGTNFDCDHFYIMTRDPARGQIAFRRGENISDRVQDGAQLWIQPIGELSLGM